jgi:hypothetical protein
MINKHEDLNRPYWVAKKKDNSILHYGKVEVGTEVATKMPIYTFEKKEEMILFIEQNDHKYIDQEIENEYFKEYDYTDYKNINDDKP